MFGIFTNWKTTVTGIVAFLVLLLSQLEVVYFTPEQEQTIVAFAILVIGLIAGDAHSEVKKEIAKKK